jgi:hypothetical protein
VTEPLDDDDTVLAGIQTSMSPEQRAEFAAKIREERAQVSEHFGVNVPGWVAFRWSSLLPREGWQWEVCRAVGTIRELAARENGDFGTALRFALAKGVLAKEKTRTEPRAFGAVAGERGAAEDLEEKLRAALWELADALVLIEAWAAHASVPEDAAYPRGAVISRAEADKHSIPGMGIVLSQKAPEGEEGMLILDSRLAAFLEERYGEAGKALAAGWREKARERWAQLGGSFVERMTTLRDEIAHADRALRNSFGSSEADVEAARAKLNALIGDSDLKHAANALLTKWWTPAPGSSSAEVKENGDVHAQVTLGPIASEAVTYLARAIWRHEIGPALERARQKPAALVRAVTSDVLDLYSHNYKTEQRGGQQALIFPEERGWVVVPSLFDGALASILERGVGLLTSQTGIDLLEWEVTEAHRQYTETGGASDFRHITIEGGWAALAHEKLGKQTKKAAEEVRAIVLAQAHLQFQAQGYRGNLLSYAEPRKHAPGQRARVTITLGDMLLAGFAHSLREERGATSLASREARRLVPILGKTALVGRRNDYAAQRRMVWRFAMALRDRAEELAERGHVAMPLDTWATLADEAGAPRSGDFIPQVLQAWKKGDERAGVEPLIVQVKGERNGYTLHESRKAALDFIVEGGRRTTKKRAEGKASARKRAEGSHKVRPQKGGA